MQQAGRWGAITVDCGLRAVALRTRCKAAAFGLGVERLSLRLLPGNEKKSTVFVDFFVVYGLQL